MKSMRILIVSDTHRVNQNFLKVIEQEEPFDLVMHCGDAEGSEYLFSQSIECPLKIVLGNNDFFSDLPREEEFEIGKYKVWLLHGHNYYVSMSNEVLKEIARQKDVDIVVYGHTHKPVVDLGRGLAAVNPGSLSYPRQYNRRPSYIVMELDEKGDAHYEIKYL